MSCNTVKEEEEIIIEIPEAKLSVSNFWKNATVYFLLADRFNNGDQTNDLPLNRKKDGAVLRSFEGGDIKGVTQKIEEGYFDKLGVNAIWMTPVVEQIHSSTDEGTGKTYAYHGYWAKDWTSLDPNFGTEADFAALVTAAHQRGIRILMDVVINHTGPVTDLDTQWPDSWVRTGPACKYQDFESTVACTLVENLPDIRTDSEVAVELPPFLKEKWKAEGRLAEEEQELDAFFEKTGYPRAPRFYIIKWLTDWVRKYGIDGFRVDTVKHTEAEIWEDLKEAARAAFWEWKAKNPSLVLDEEDFYMVGEVYGYYIGAEKIYDYGDRKVDFFANGFESLINFSFKGDATSTYDSLFSKYSEILNNDNMNTVSVMNYLTSHDDGSPFDPQRTKSHETATKLMLSPGAAQIYYGDETARPLVIEGANGDANLRSFMNWADLEEQSYQDLLAHWQKLGQFRKKHLAIGAGKHQQLQAAPYLFKRTLQQEDEVLVGFDLNNGVKTIPVYDTFQNGAQVRDFYSGTVAKVQNGEIQIDSPYDIVLIEAAE
ncbi:MAG: alpha-amylase family glycosyl hydrolase [Bacteroidota bacterium]